MRLMQPRREGTPLKYQMRDGGGEVDHAPADAGARTSTPHFADDASCSARAYTSATRAILSRVGPKARFTEQAVALGFSERTVKLMVPASLHLKRRTKNEPRPLCLVVTVGR